ncbi:hypothetical protein PWR63_01705 [Paraburkholderia sp. A2WS-5]|uniref:hypothetical protein n=1 Tax=unclassified Paraburkholderia TaxID=2615204 RepID=UPI003B778E63
MLAAALVGASSGRFDHDDTFFTQISLRSDKPQFAAQNIAFGGRGNQSPKLPGTQRDRIV